MTEVYRALTRERTLEQNLAKFDQFVNSKIDDDEKPASSWPEEANEAVKQRMTYRAIPRRSSRKPRQKTEEAKTMVEDVDEAVIIEEVSVRISEPAQEVMKLLAAEAEQYTEKESRMSKALTKHAKVIQGVKEKLGRCSDTHGVSDDEDSKGRDSPATTRTESPLSHIGHEDEIMFEEFVADAADSFCSFMLCEGLFPNNCCNKQKKKKCYDDDETCFTAATGYSTVAGSDGVLL